VIVYWHSFHIYQPSARAADSYVRFLDIFGKNQECQKRLEQIITRALEQGNLPAHLSDMSWLAFGFDPPAACYTHTYKYYPHIEGSTTSWRYCGCTSCVVAVRSMTILRSMSDNRGGMWDTPLFQVARACLRSLASGGFPYAPLLAHHWMMCGRLSLQAQ